MIRDVSVNRMNEKEFKSIAQQIVLNVFRLKCKNSTKCISENEATETVGILRVSILYISIMRGVEPTIS